MQLVDFIQMGCINGIFLYHSAKVRFFFQCSPFHLRKKNLLWHCVHFYEGL